MPFGGLVDLVAAAAAVFLRLWLGFIFLTSGASKAFGAETRRQLDRQAETAVSTPWLTVWMLLGLAEMSAGAGVLVGYRTLAATGIMVGLLSIFTVFLAWVLRRGLLRTCRCGGLLGNELVTKALLIRNGFLVAGAGSLLALTAVASASLSLSFDCALVRCLTIPAGPALAGTVLGLACAAVTLYLYWRFRPRESLASAKHPSHRQHDITKASPEHRSGHLNEASGPTGLGEPAGEALDGVVDAPRRVSP